MRIAMMADVYKPHVSGITNYIDLNKRYLEKAGHEVFVFTFGDQDYHDEELRVIRSPGLPLVDTGYYLSFRHTAAAKKLLQTMDIVHVHHPFISGRLALRYCEPLHIPTVFTNHTRYDLYAQAYLPIVPEEISDGLLQAYMPPFCEAMSLVISPSAGMEKILRGMGVTSPISIIPNGVELQSFYQAEPLSRADFGFKESDVIARLCRTHRNRKKSFLPASIVCRRGAGARSCLSYDFWRRAKTNRGGDEAACGGTQSQSARPFYRFYSIRKGSVLSRHVRRVRDRIGYRSPSAFRHRRHGSGLPVIGIDSPGVGDTIEDGKTGFLTTQDLASFTAKLTRLCLDASLRKQMGDAARQASTRYAIERTTKTMLEQYERLVYASRPRRENWEVRLRGLLEKFLQ